ncbi:MAG TPA: SdrD B-like domain-containing protein, partial [Marmoricola sp.]|nr:SdrD B-like domain-containing protein [Marmoricola sp.]
MNPLGIAGNATCNTDADPGGQAVADSCDQVPVQLPNPTVMPGNVSGMVWADGDRDGVKDASEPMIGSVPVTLFDGDTIVGQTMTDVNGVYLFTNVPPRSGYQVSFGIKGLTPSGVVLGALGLDASKAWSYGYTTRAAGCAANVSCAAPGTQRTYPVNVTAGGHAQNLNAGVVLANAGLSVVKTSTAGDPASLQVRADGTTAPVPVTITWTNEGSEPLTGLAWDDNTLSGPDLTGIACEYAGVAVDGDTVLPAGESVDCVATLPSMGVNGVHEDEFTVTGVGTVSGTPVAASDRWQAVSDGAASWTMSKTADPVSGTQVKVGSEIEYTIVVTNTGDLNLEDLLVTDDLSRVLNNAELVSELPVGVERSGTTLFWNVPLLAPGASMQIEYTVKVDEFAWEKVLLNKAYGSGVVEPAQC